MLHLAIWNERAASVAVLLGEWPTKPNPWRSRVKLNIAIKVRLLPAPQAGHLAAHTRNTLALQF